MAWWLGFWAFTAEVWVQSLVRKLGFHNPSTWPNEKMNKEVHSEKMSCDKSCLMGLLIHFCTLKDFISLSN